MKKMKSGFTLAEVLVALTIIGVTAALVLPTTFSSYQAKTVGVKVAKFAGQLETASRNYVANYGSFSKSSDVVKFVNKSFLTKDTYVQEGVDIQAMISDMQQMQAQQAPATRGGEKSSVSEKALNSIDIRIPIVEQEHDEMPKAVALLRDGTGITVIKQNNLEFKTHAGFVNRYQVGDPMFVVKFFPNLNGLPSFAQQNFNFVVTETGYIYPHDKDNCLWDLYLNDYATTPDTYSEGSSCVLSGTYSSSGSSSGSGTNSNKIAKLDDESFIKHVDTMELMKDIINNVKSAQNGSKKYESLGKKMKNGAYDQGSQQKP